MRGRAEREGAHVFNRPTALRNHPEKLAILDPNLNVTEPGLRKVVATLQLAGDIASEQKFDLARFTDLSFWKASREKR